MENVLEDILIQFDKSKNGYGEPQAFVEIDKDRVIEVTKEMEGLGEEEYFYSCLLHCSEEEFDNDKFYSTGGIMQAFCTDDLSKSNLESTLRKVIEINKVI